jgi:hypothetical protein
MYIEWKRVESESEDLRDKIRLVAILNGGLDKGVKTRETITPELASIKERYITARVKTMREFHKGLFWAAIDKKLDQLSLETHIRQAIEAEIGEKISRPDEQWALWGVTCVPCYD